MLRGKFALVIALGAAGLQFRIHAVPGACLGLAVSGGLAGGEPVGDVPAVRPREAEPPRVRPRAPDRIGPGLAGWSGCGC